MNNLRSVRKSDSRKLTQQDIADWLGIERSTYGKYETGDSEPNFDTICRLADFFDVSVEYLMGRTNIKKTPTPEDFGLSSEESELLALFRKASPAVRVAALSVLKIDT